MEYDIMQTADRIKGNRARLRLTQEQLGAAIGVSRQHVSKWETGSSSPSLAMLRRLAKALGCTPGELVPE
ncbi:MAG: helix-turn-helix domain-containing protein [Alphaproteobacteria bacterium]